MPYAGRVTEEDELKTIGADDDDTIFTRRGWCWLTPIAVAAVIIVAPGIAGALLPAGAATAATLIALFGAAIVGGAVDGATFQTTSFVPLIILASFAFASALYFNDGVWFYGLLLAVLFATASGIAHHLTRKQG